jgi:hypothetical protein
MLVFIISKTGYAGLQMGEAPRTHTERISLVAGATEGSGAKQSAFGEGVLRSFLEEDDVFSNRMEEKVLFSVRKNENFQ